MKLLGSFGFMRHIGVLSICLAALFSDACAKRPVYRPPPHGSQHLLGPASQPEAPHGDSEPRRDAAGTSTMVVVTLEDARSDEHRDGMTSWIEEHDGFTGEATTGDKAYSRPVADMASDALADALIATGRFENVVRASSKSEKTGDLFLCGRIRRLRGWQAYRVDESQPTRLLESMGDVFIDDVTISDKVGRTLFLGQTGAMLKEKPAEVDPYLVAQQALDEALIELASSIAGSDLDEELEHEVSLPESLGGDVDDLLFELPGHWTGARTEATRPLGWKAKSACPAVRLKDGSRRFFHPRMSFYSPSIDLWFCEKGWSGEIGLSGDQEDRFPAEVIGFTAEGEAVLALSLGKTSWPTAFADLYGYLGLVPAPTQPVMRLPIGGEREETHLGPPGSFIGTGSELSGFGEEP